MCAAIVYYYKVRGERERDGTKTLFQSTATFGISTATTKQTVFQKKLKTVEVKWVTREKKSHGAQLQD